MFQHPIAPIYDEQSRVLILGSFPSVKSREATFYYAHPQNRFWRVLASVCGLKTPETEQEKHALLLSNGIALWDVIAYCEIVGSSDASIKHVIPNDIGMILENAEIAEIFVNGKAAEKYYRKYLEKPLGRACTVLPSTSPANAALSFEALLAVWRENLEKVIKPEKNA